MPSALAEKVHSLMLRDFLNGTLQPGDILNRRQLALAYDVSVTPVLEAITLLEIEGFVETLPRKGTKVKPINQTSILESFMLRDAIETKAARLYHGQTIRNHLDELLQLAADVDHASDKNFEDWMVEIHFHHRLVELAGYTALTRTYEQAMHLNIFFGMTQFIPASRQVPRDNHINLITNLADAKSANEAGSIIRKHVWYGKEYILERSGLSLEEI